VKKQIALLVALFTTVSILSTGCTTQTPKGQNTSSSANLYTSAGQYPIVNQKITLKVLIPQSTEVQDFATNEFTKYLEQKTNIHIEWQTAPSDADSLKQKVGLIMSAGNLPDMFLDIGASALSDSKYGVEQKLLMDISDKIDSDMPNFKKFLATQTSVKGSISATDGKIYGLPGWNDCYHCSCPQKMWINTMWLSKLGIKTPTTTDEFYQALKTFKEKNPKGIALVGNTDGWDCNIDTFLMDSFVFDSGTENDGGTGKAERLYFSVNDKKVTTSVNQQGYKDGLTYLNKLYKEGLIYSGSFTQKVDQMKELIASKGEPVFCVVGGANVNWMDSATTPQLYKDYSTLAPLKGPTGLQQTTYLKYDALVQMQLAISKTCKYPDAALRWADYFYTLEGNNNAQIGAKGSTNWTDAASGDLGLDAKPALYNRVRAYSNEAQNINWQDSGILFETSEIRLGQKTEQNVDVWSAAGLEKLLYTETEKNYTPYISKTCEVLPTLKLTTDEAQQLQTTIVEVDKSIAESRTQFIMGNLSISKDWDTYIKSLDNMGLQKLIQTYQKAYDRQYAKS
jgi:putative aldouronate transport system substrate-binding protein